MPGTLLCVDDSKTIQSAYEIAFAHEGFEVVQAMSVEEGLQKARSLRPSLVLLDNSLPGSTGYQVCQMLRSDPATSSIPILVMAGSAAPFDEATARQAGATDHMAKPFECAALVERVRSLTGIAEGAVEATTTALPADTALPLPPPYPVPSPVTTPPAPVLRTAAAPASPRPLPTIPQDPASLWAVVEPAVEAEPEMPPPASIPLAAPVEATVESAAAIPLDPPAASPAASVPAPASSVRPPTAFPWQVNAAPPAAPSAVTPTSADPFGLSLDDDMEDDVDVDISFDLVGGEPQPSELTLEPPPRPSAAPDALQAATLPPLMPSASPVEPELAEIELTELSAEDLEPIEEEVVPVAASARSIAPASHEQVSAATREVIERIVWEVVPELAETMIREELERLLGERGGR